MGSDPITTSAAPRIHRTLFHYMFESGSVMSVNVEGEQPTDDVIWALEQLVEQKKREMAKLQEAAQ